jgi:hypothetical protein
VRSDTFGGHRRSRSSVPLFLVVMSQKATTISKRFESFVSRLTGGGVASPSHLVGCSDSEINRLERTYNGVLPSSYRLFLQRMGHCSGRLFTHDHVLANYSDVVRMRKEQLRFRKNTQRLARVTLPPDSLVMMSRLDEQWLFVRCVGGDDTPVLSIEAGGEVQQSHPSVLDWLDTWREEAEEAIASGYYES